MSYTFRVELTRNWDISANPVCASGAHNRLTEQPQTPTILGGALETQGKGNSLEQPENRPLNTPGARSLQPNQVRPPSVSALRLSLLSGLQPVSSTENPLYCSETEEDIRGTGVYAFSTKTHTGNNDRKTNRYEAREIGTIHKNRGSWMEDLSTARHPTHMGGLRSPGSSGSPVIQTEERSPTEGLPPLAPSDKAQARPDTNVHMEPAVSQKAILALNPPPLPLTENPPSRHPLPL